jgi:hypothetical protein
MRAMTKAECAECGKGSSKYVLLQVCIPTEGTDGEEHEKIMDITLCRGCVNSPKTLGSIGMLIAHEVKLQD